MTESPVSTAVAAPDATKGEELIIPVPEGYALDVTSHVGLADGAMNAIGDAEVVEGMNEGFKCPISLRLMDAPCEINCSNHHVFDKSSIDRYEQSTLGACRKCPLCRGYYHRSREVPSLRRIIGSTVSRKCPYCSAIFKAGDLLDHVKCRCPEAEVTCTYAPCNAKFKRKDLAQHRRDACLGVPLPCLNAGCQSLLNRKMMVEHLSHCRFQDVKCPDCGQTHKRGESEAHAKVCVEKEVECNLCGAMIKRLVMVAHLSDTSLLGQHLMGVVTLQRQVNSAQQEQAQLQGGGGDNGGGDEDEEEEKKDETEGRGNKRRRDQRSPSPSPPLTGAPGLSETSDSDSDAMVVETEGERRRRRLARRFSARPRLSTEAPRSMLSSSSWLSRSMGGNNRRASAPESRRAVDSLDEDSSSFDTRGRGASASPERRRGERDRRPPSDVMTWNCERCTFRNTRRYSICEMCSSSRGSSRPPTRRPSLSTAPSTSAAPLSSRAPSSSAAPSRAPDLYSWAMHPYGFTQGFGTTPSTLPGAPTDMGNAPPPLPTQVPPPNSSGFPYFWWPPPMAPPPGVPGSSATSSASSTTVPASMPTFGRSNALPSPPTWTPDVPPPHIPLRLPLSARRTATGAMLMPTSSSTMTGGAGPGSRSGSRGTPHDEQARVTFTLDVNDSDTRLSRPLRSPPYRWGPPSPPGQGLHSPPRSSPEQLPRPEVHQPSQPPPMIDRHTFPGADHDHDHDMDEHKGDN